MVCPSRVHGGRRGRHGGLLCGGRSWDIVRSLRMCTCVINVFVGTQVSSWGQGVAIKRTSPTLPHSLPFYLM